MKNSVVALAAASLSLSVLVGLPGTGPVAAEPLEDRVPRLLVDVDQNAVGLAGSGLAVSEAAAFFGHTGVVDGVKQSQLWRHDRASGANEVVFTAPNLRSIRPLAATDDLVMFTAESDELGAEPWVYYESTGQAELLMDIMPGTSGSSVRDVVVGDRIYFVARDGSGREVWATKGTPETTERLADLNPGSGSSDPRELAVLTTGPSMSSLIFIASSPATGQELFRFVEGDGLAPIEINPGASSSSPQSPVYSSDGVLYFEGQESGVPSSLYQVADLGVSAGSEVIEEIVLGSQLSGIAVVGSTLYARSRNTSGWGLWKVDGAGSTPEIVDDTFFGTNLVGAGDGLLFTQSPASGTDIGVSDGTAVGTVVDVTLSAAYNSPVRRSAGSGVLFSATDVIEGGGNEPWIATGVAGSTVELLDLRPGPYGSQPRSFTDGGDAWFFFADDGVRGVQLWSTDGTTVGTKRLTDIDVNVGQSSDPRNFQSAGTSTYFTTRRPDGTRALWVHRRDTDAVDEIPAPGGGLLSARGSLIQFGDSVIFAGDDGQSGYEPWISDGTDGGTRRLADTAPGPDDGLPYRFALVDDTITFVAAGGIWVVRPGSLAASLLTSESLAPFASIGRTTLAEGCAPDCGVHGIDIDTGESTLLVAEVKAGSSATFDGAVYFAVSPGVGLYRSDGTPDGTRAIAAAAGIAVGRMAATSDRLIATDDSDSDDFSLFAVDRADQISAIAVPEGLGLQSVDLNTRSLLLGSGGLIAAAVPVDSAVGEEKAGPADAAPGEFLVVIDGDELAVVTLFASQHIEWLGQYQDQVVVLTVPIDDDEEKKVAQTPTGPMLWTFDDDAGTVTSLADLGAAGLQAYYWATLGGDLLYGGGLMTATGVEPFVFDLASDPIATDPALVSLPPARLLDTRANGETVDDLFEKVGKVAAGAFVELDVLGRGGVPAADVNSVVLNVTMIRPDGIGFITTYPCGERPNASSLNAPSGGGVVANEVIAKISSLGTLCLYSSVGTHIAADVTGYVPAASAVTSVVPGRLLDTRENGQTVDDLFEKLGKVAAGRFVELDVLGRGGVPVAGVGSVVLNVTMIRPDGDGFVTLHSCGKRPNASSLNAPDGGGVVANEVIAKVSSSGTVCLYSSVGTNLAADVTGYVPEGAGVTSLTPGRLLDTRSTGETVDDLFEKVGRLEAGEFVELDVLGRGGVPVAGVGSVVLNVTMIRPDGDGFVSTYPCNERPNASSMNAPEGGGVVANEVIAKVSSSGTVCLYSSVGTHLAADVTGYVVV